MVAASRYNSTSGLATKSWGPNGWYFLFSCIMGGYPPKLNPELKEHRQIKRHFKNMLLSLGHTMPCIFCRESYKQFYKELPIEQFTGSRIEMMKWLYLIRDKVNRKLIAQERECYIREKKAFKAQFRKGELTKREYYEKVAQMKSETLITEPSPPFAEVLEKYESIRAGCSKRAKTCAIKQKEIN